MNLYLMTFARKASEFAHFATVGTWKERGYCPHCTSVGAEIVAPLLMEWEPGSENIGDFSWDLGYVFVAKGRVRRELASIEFGLSFFPVRHVPYSEKRYRSKPRVAVPYKGEPLYWAVPKVFLPLNEKKSRVKMEERCTVCGYTKKTFRKSSIVIDGPDWHGENVFRISQNGNSQASFVTETGMTILSEAKYTNLRFLKAGKIAN